MVRRCLPPAAGRLVKPGFALEFHCRSVECNGMPRMHGCLDLSLEHDDEGCEACAICDDLREAQ